MASHVGLEAVRPWELAGVDASFRGLSFCWPVITSGPLSEPLSDEGRLIGRLGFADPAARGLRGVKLTLSIKCSQFPDPARMANRRGSR